MEVDVVEVEGGFVLTFFEGGGNVEEVVVVVVAVFLGLFNCEKVCVFFGVWLPGVSVGLTSVDFISGSDLLFALLSSMVLGVDFELQKVRKKAK